MIETNLEQKMLNVVSEAKQVNEQQYVKQLYGKHLYDTYNALIDSYMIKQNFGAVEELFEEIKQWK